MVLGPVKLKFLIGRHVGRGRRCAVRDGCLLSGSTAVRVHLNRASPIDSVQANPSMRRVKVPTANTNTPPLSRLSPPAVRWGEERLVRPSTPVRDPSDKRAGQGELPSLGLAGPHSSLFDKFQERPRPRGIRV